MFSHHFFNRKGGVSQGRFATLNVSERLGDTPSHVRENRQRVKEFFGVTHLVGAHQVHGDRIHVVDRPVEADQEIDGVDALMTELPDILLLIQQADCQAVLLHDPVRPAIAAIHSGWRGSVADIIGTTVAAMRRRYGTIPANLSAFIGPSLGPCCAEFRNYQTEFPLSFHPFQVRPSYFDFRRISSWQLVCAGVPPAAIHVTDICTSCSTDYFSYRRATRSGDPVTGRHCSAVHLC